MNRSYSIVKKDKEVEAEGLDMCQSFIDEYKKSVLLLKCVTEDGIHCYAEPGAKGWLRFMYHGLRYVVKKKIRSC